MALNKTDDVLNSTQPYLDFAGAIILAVNPDETVRYINKKGCAVLGTSKEAVLGKNWFDHFIPEEARPELKNLFSALLQGVLQPYEFLENTIVNQQGEIRYIRWQNTVIRDESGKIIGTLSTGEDITEKKLLLQRLSESEKQKRKELLAAVLKAQEMERHEIANELHDNINQILATCKLLLEQEMHNGNTSPFVSNSSKLIFSAIQEIRNLSHRLNPAELKDIDFKGALQELIRKVNMAKKFKIKLSCKGKAHFKLMEPAMMVSLYRIVQEGLNNIIKYAQATHVHITIEATAHTVDLEIRDNGVGFKYNEVNKGFGLKSIYNRTEYHNGKVYINTAPGEGCTISVCIPIGDLV